MEDIEAAGLNIREGAFGDDVADLKVVDAIDEDDQAAVVDVAEAVFGIGWMAGNAQPKDVDGDAVIDERQMGGVARDGVAAVATDGKGRGDFYGAVGGVGDDADDGAIGLLEETGRLPTHAEVEARVARGFLCEKVEEVPLGHERDELCMSWEVGEIGHGVGVIAEVGGGARDLGVRDGEEFVEQAELVENLECGGMDGVAAEVAEEVFVLF